jgi:hypothetical protein
MTEINISASGESAQAAFNAVLDSLSLDTSGEVTVTINFGDFNIRATGDSIAEVRDRFNAVQYNETPTSFSTAMTISVDADDVDVDAVPTEPASQPPADEAIESQSSEGMEPNPERIKPNTMEHVVLSISMRHLQQSASWFSDTSSDDFGQFSDSYIIDTPVSSRVLVESPHHNLSLTMSQTSNTLSRLEQKGLLERELARKTDHDQDRGYVYFFNRSGISELIRLWEADYEASIAVVEAADGSDTDSDTDE